MKVLLTSCGLETEAIKNAFQKLLPKPAAEVKAIFIPTAANSPEAIFVLPKCLNDLLDCGIKEENIFVYDLHDEINPEQYGTYGVVYLCGGSPDYLLRRINEGGFRQKLQEFIGQDGVVLGVSAGSVIFAANLPENLGLLACPLDVHCDEESCEKPGRYPKGRKERLRLGNNQGILVEEERITVFQ